MKLKLTNFHYTVLIAFTIIVASCSKDGATGPTGPAGPAGPAGSAGSAGVPGANGATGTANVMYSDWIDTVAYQPFYTDSSAWVAQITAPQLVDSILSRGEIKLYCNIGSDSTTDEFIIALPMTDANITGIFITPYYATQTITLSANFDASSYTSGLYHHFRYRYILIPGGVKVLRPVKGATNSSIDWNDYKQVKQYLGLKD